MIRIQPVEYQITIDTGESLSIVEWDINLMDWMSDPKYQEALRPVFSLCPKISRAVMEEIKTGYFGNFKKLLNSSPDRNLIKLSNPICVHINTCGMADKIVCNTRNIQKKQNNFPICWEFEPKKVSDEMKSDISYIGGLIIQAWKNHSHVVIVS